MDTNAILDPAHEMQSQLWVDKVNETHRQGLLCEWVSTFHPHKLPCQLDSTFHYGAFNAGVKMVFSGNSAWMVRFPRVGMVCDKHADEKVAMEIAALQIIRAKTTIPVPEVRTWGPTASNSLGLGPFIMMDFINGVSLSDILKDPKAKQPSRLMREDIDDSDIEFIYRQFANFLLQLFMIDFDRIGSLPLPNTESQNPTSNHPLTFKAHTILQNGGVDTFGMISIPVTSTLLKMRSQVIEIRALQRRLSTLTMSLDKTGSSSFSNQTQRLAYMMLKTNMWRLKSCKLWHVIWLIRNMTIISLS